jgi:hypothetical protein
MTQVADAVPGVRRGRARRRRQHRRRRRRTPSTRPCSAIAERLLARADAVLAANKADVDGADLPPAMVDRLRLDPARLDGMAHQLRVLAEVPHPQWSRVVRELPGALVEERRKPVGVIGANFEARPNVVVDIASQLLKSRNAGVLRTGSAAIGSAAALLDEVIAPALAASGLDPAAIQLVRLPGRDTARALVAQPDLVPLVILRGSGDSTRELTAEAARHGVRTLAHADGGGRPLPRPRRRRRQGARPGRAEPGPARRLQPAQPAADPPGPLGRPAARRTGGARPAGHRRVVAAARPPARAGVGAAGRPRGDGDDRPGRRAGRGGPARRRGDLGLGRRHRDRGPRRGGRVPGHVRRDRCVLERHHPAAGRVQAARRAGDRDQRGPAARARAAPVTFLDLHLRQFVVTQR